MGEVKDIFENTPHLAGVCTCTECQAKWTAVAPVGVFDLECPKCGKMTGQWDNPIEYQEYPHWRCACGSTSFCITTEFTYCPKCGVKQDFKSL